MPTVVFDTNVAIALVVFADPRLSLLASAWANRAIRTVAERRTLDEFDRVLAYPDLALDPSRIALASRMYRDRCIDVGSHERLNAEHGHRDRRHRSDDPDRAFGRPLPRCSDPDDQVFIELAAASRADWLLTRDKALLRLCGRVRFGLASPERFQQTVLECGPVQDAVRQRS